MSTPTASRNDRWPPQIKYIVGNEAAERFSYYGMKAILALYITNVLMQTKDQTTNILHIFGFVNYFMPVLGAWVSDRLLGRYKTILWISLAYCVGHGVLALSDAIHTIDGKIACLYVGLGLIAFGSGGIKPCVSAFMGDQFRPDQKHLLQKAYAAFYFSINFGSFFSFLAIPWIRKEWGYSWAFGVPGVFMGLATLVFWLGTRHYVMVPPARVTKRAGFLKIAWLAISEQPAHVPSEIWKRVRSPATVLILIGSVGLFLHLLAFTVLSIQSAFGEAWLSQIFSKLTAREAWVVWIGWLIQIVSLCIILVAGVRLKDLRSRGLVAFASILLIIPISSPFPLIGQIVGIWLLTVLTRSAVARQFSLTKSPDVDMWSPALHRVTTDEVEAARSLGPILSIFALLPIFWALFDQTFSTWVLQGEMMKSFFVSKQVEEVKFTPDDIDEPDALTTVFLFATNSASTRVTKTSSTVLRNDAAAFVWSQFSPASQQLLRDTNQPPERRAGIISTEFNKIVAGDSFFSSNRFANVRLGSDVNLMLKTPLPSDEVARFNRLLLEDTFPTEIGKLYRIGPEEMLAANPALVLVFVPIMTLCVYPFLGGLVTPLRRMSAGMFVSAISFVAVAMLQSRIEQGQQLSVLWQFVPYIILTMAEVLVSTTGLEFAFGQAHSTMKSTIMGFWYLAVAYGNLMVSFITAVLAKEGGSGAHEASVSTGRFLLYAGVTAGFAILFSLVAAKYKYRDAEPAIPTKA